MYYAAGWVKTDSATPDTVELTMQVIDNGLSSSHAIISGQASSAKWTWLSGYVTLPVSSSGLTDVRFSVGGPRSGVKLIVDNCYFAPVTGLRRAASAYPDLRLGAGGVDISHFDSSPKFAAAFSSLFHYASPGNSLKFELTEREDSKFTFEEADSIIDEGLARGGSSRGHVFVWHNQISPFASATTNSEALKTILWNNIEKKGSYFRGRLQHWDVVNESFSDSASEVLRKDVTWYDKPGIGYPPAPVGAPPNYGYIRESFKKAREVDPNAVLSIAQGSLIPQLFADPSEQVIRENRDENI